MVNYLLFGFWQKVVYAPNQNMEGNMKMASMKPTFLNLTQTYQFYNR